MTDYKRLTDEDWLTTISVNDTNDAKLIEYAFRLWQLENQIKIGILVDIEAVAKLMIEIMDNCLCNFDNIAEYMYEHCSDWCDKSCDSVSATGDYTPCWVKYLTAKFEEL